MTLSTILAFARAQAQTDSNGLTDANGIIFANEALQDFHRKLVKAGVDASQIQEAYQSATAGTGTYLYPTNALFLKAIELNYSDTSANGYKLATQVDVSNLPGNTSFSWLRGNASKAAPMFDDHGDWFEIFPTPTSADNVSQLMRIFYYLQPTQYTATSDTVAYPESLDASILGWRIAASYLYSLGQMDKKMQADAFFAKYDQRVDDYIKTLGRGSQQPTQVTPLQISGWQF
jgi:hypothetical protein